MRILWVQTVSYVNKLLRPLRDENRPLMGCKDFGFFPKQRRMPKVYFLNTQGRDFLVSELWWDVERVKFARRRCPLYARDLFHRLYTVDFHIQFRRWCIDIELDASFRSYFEQDMDTLPPFKFPTSRKLVEADWVWVYGEDSSRRAFLFEQHNGTQSLRAFEKIKDHVHLMAEGGASDMLGCQSVVGVFFVFEDQDCMKKTLQRLRRWEPFTAFQDLFRFRSAWEEFLDGWRTAV